MTTGLAAQTTERPVTFRNVIPDLAEQQKDVWTSPARLFRKRNLLPTLAVLGTTAALIASDSTTGRYFRNSNSFASFNSEFNSSATNAEILAAPAVLYLAGFAAKDSYSQQTALLSAEALANAEIVVTVFKAIDRRKRPADFPPHSGMSDSWFERKGVTGGGFPSGHTIGAFAIATVVARRYHEHRWVPYVAYGLASTIGFSRMTLAQHFPSDVFFGAVLGYSIARFPVLHQ